MKKYISELILYIVFASLIGLIALGIGFEPTVLGTLTILIVKQNILVKNLPFWDDEK